MTRSVYVVQSDQGVVKVGIAGNPRKRLYALQIATPHRLQLAQVLECNSAYEVERRCHEILSEHHAGGEWFRVNSTEAVGAVYRAAGELGVELHLPTPVEPKTRGPQKTPTKKLVSLRLSPLVLEHFKAGGPGWQSRIDSALLALATRPEKTAVQPSQASKATQPAARAAKGAPEPAARSLDVPLAGTFERRATPKGAKR